MEKRISIDQFRNVIKKLESDKPVISSRVYYTTQKEHWLCFLYNYDFNQAYGRLQGMNRDAKFVYNHIVCPSMLVYLIKAVGFDSELIDQVEKVNESGKTMMESSGKIRKIVPWSMIYKKLWGDENHPGMVDPIDLPIWEKIRNKFL